MQINAEVKEASQDCEIAAITGAPGAVIIEHTRIPSAQRWQSQPHPPQHLRNSNKYCVFQQSLGMYAPSSLRPLPH